jgi:hypothetical protein
MTVSTKTRCIVWAHAAGRCQFPGCNKLLIGDLIAGNDKLNTAYVAHIVAETEGGPRGDHTKSPILADNPDNLMLMCDSHHRLIDRDELHNYPEDRLIQIKQESERRIELATDMGPDRASNIVRYGATIGTNESVIAFSKCKEAIAPTHYCAAREPIDLSLSGLDLSDSDPDFYSLQAKNLRRQFEAKIKGRLESQEIGHISLFALAPMPLLIELGRLLSDITPTSVYQLHREEPTGWGWVLNDNSIEIKTKTLGKSKKQIALKLAISAKISDERITSVLGSDTSIWSIEAVDPHNDIIRSPEDLSSIRRILRSQLSAIKSTHGENAIINVFPAIPVSVAIELGRVWMPKADLPLCIFDQSYDSGGFVQRLQIRHKQKT